MSESPYAALAAELRSAYASGLTPFLEEATAYQWMGACHDLWEAGDINIVEFAARLLYPEFPGITYLQTLVALFDAMPRFAQAPIAFRNDPSAEIQIIQRPDCAYVLLCFCAAGGTLGLPVNFIHQWLGRLPTSLVYIKDFRNLCGGCGFPSLGPDRASAVAALRHIAKEIGGKKLYTLGVSLGGYAALYYGLELQATSILSFAGATDYTPEFVNSLGPPSKDYSNLCSQAPDYVINLRDACAAAADRTQILIAYSANQTRDRLQAERLAGLSNVELIGVNYAQHNVLDPLIRERRLMFLLRHFFADERIG